MPVVSVTPPPRRPASAALSQGEEALVRRPTKDVVEAKASPLTPAAVVATPLLNAFSGSELRALRATCQYWRARIDRSQYTLTSTQQRWAARTAGVVDATLAHQLVGDNNAVRDQIHIFPDKPWSMQLAGDCHRTSFTFIGNKRLCMRGYAGTFLFEGMRAGRPNWSQISSSCVGLPIVSDSGQFVVGVRDEHIDLWERIPPSSRETGWLARSKAMVRTTPGYVLRQRQRLPGRLTSFYASDEIFWTGAGTREDLRVGIKTGSELHLFGADLAHLRSAISPKREARSLCFSYHAASQRVSVAWDDGVVARASIEPEKAALGWTHHRLANPIDGELPNVDLAASRHPQWSELDALSRNRAFLSAHATASGNRLISLSPSRGRKTRIDVRDLTVETPVSLFSWETTDSLHFLSSDADGSNIALRSARRNSAGDIMYGIVYVDMAKQQVRQATLEKRWPTQVNWAETSPALGVLSLRYEDRTRTLLFKATDAQEMPMVYSVLSNEKDADAYAALGFEASGRYFFQYAADFHSVDQQYGPRGPSAVRVFSLTTPPASQL